MRLLFSVSHPAHVHLFKNIIWGLEGHGHTVHVVARGKDKTLNLLEAYEIDYELISNAESSIWGFAKEMVIRTTRFIGIIREFKPDLVISQMDPSPAIASKVSGVPYICLADSEPAKLILHGTLPFIEAVLTPSCFKTNLGEKQIYYSGYKELAYLHPNIFKPDISVLNDIGMGQDDPYILIRFVSWNAHHDIGEWGIQDKKKVVKELEKYGTVFISSEKSLEPKLKKYELKISPEKIHDVLYYARVLVCDSQTMTTEAGILGTPAIRCNSFVGENDMGNFIELEKKYNLIFNFRGEEDTIQKAIDLLQLPDLKAGWARRRDALLKDKIDLSLFMIWFVENFPRSLYEMKKDPEIQYKFSSPLQSEKSVLR